MLNNSSIGDNRQRRRHIKLDSRINYSPAEFNGVTQNVDENYVNSHELYLDTLNADTGLNDVSKGLLDAGSVFAALDKTQGALSYGVRPDGSPLFRSTRDYAREVFGIDEWQVAMLEKAAATRRELIEDYGQDYVDTIPQTVGFYKALSEVPRHRRREAIDAAYEEYGQDGLIGGTALRKWCHRNLKDEQNRIQEDSDGRTPWLPFSDYDENGYHEPRTTTPTQFLSLADADANLGNPAATDADATVTVHIEPKKGSDTETTA